MRLVASILLCAVALSAGAAEIWRWRDANGVVHYSDQPRPGAERISAGAPPPGSEALPDVTARPDEANDRGADGRGQQPEAYTSCTVVSPADNENFQGVQPVTVQLSVGPQLQPGHRIQLLVNGAAVPEWPADATSYTLPEVFRGSHTLSVRVLDARGRPVCSGPSITFYVRQQSLIRPGRSGA
jgi:hypothetical protein